MAKSGKSWRSFTALLVTWAFLVLIVTGLGRKTLAEVCAQVGMAPAAARERLEAAGIGLTDDETFRAVADRYGLGPIDLLTVMLVEGYRPEGG